MKILYIHRKMYNETGWFQTRFKHLGQKLKRKFIFRDRRDFFRASLHKSLNTTEKNIEFAQSSSPVAVESEYDWIMISHEAHCADDEPDRFRELLEITRKFDLPQALFIGHDQSSYLPPDEILKAFRLIFKREPYKDLSRYEISDENRQKIRPTMLHCPLLTPNLLSLCWVDPKEVGYRDLPSRYVNDVFFLGQYCNELRKRIWEQALDLDVHTEGGLYQSTAKFQDLPPKLRGEKMEIKTYSKKLHRSRINLTLTGAGPFTHRHLETWACCGFMLSDSRIEEISLPFKHQKDKHYATFNSPEDFQRKTTYYLENPRERREIARNGRELFEEEYDFKKHGNYIRRQLLHNGTGTPVLQ